MLKLYWLVNRTPCDYELAWRIKLDLEVPKGSIELVVNLVEDKLVK